jgi:hypothetical protein
MALQRPNSAVICDLHKWGRVLKTPAPWRPAQLEPGRTRGTGYCRTPSRLRRMARKPEPETTTGGEPHGGNQEATLEELSG